MCQRVIVSMGVGLGRTSIANASVQKNNPLASVCVVMSTIELGSAMSHLAKASGPVRPDIYACFLLLSTEFEDDSAKELTGILEGSPKGVPYMSPDLDSNASLSEMPWRLVRAALWQLYANLLLLMDSDEPEVVHQARIGWRRLRTCCRLLNAMPDLPSSPPVMQLRPLLNQLREVRDIDVARYDILPRASRLIPIGDAATDSEWRPLYAALESEAAARRTALRRMLIKPAVGEALWEQVLWLLQLEEFGQQVPRRLDGGNSLVQWARHHIRRMHRKFKRAQERCQDAETQHRARIWAKRLRYACEDFRKLLPHAARKWQKEAVRLQSDFGTQRDLQTAAALAERHGAEHIASCIRRLASA